MVQPVRSGKGELTHFIGYHRDASERLKSAERSTLSGLPSWLREDRLTGLHSRAYFEELLQRDWALAQRDSHEIGLTLFDIDDLGAYNDKFDRAAGDACIRRVARVIGASYRRGGDLVGRWEGGTFAVLTQGDAAERAAHYAQIVAQRVRDLLMHHPTAGAGRYVTVSAAVASLVPPRTLALEGLLRACQAAMKRAKKNGKDAIVDRGGGRLQRLSRADARSARRVPAPARAARFAYGKIIGIISTEMKPAAAPGKSPSRARLRGGALARHVRAARFLGVPQARAGGRHRRERRDALAPGQRPEAAGVRLQALAAGGAVRAAVPLARCHRGLGRCRRARLAAQPRTRALGGVPLELIREPGRPGAHALTTWTPPALASEAHAYARTLYRVVEAQHRASTMRLVDSLEEQASARGGPGGRASRPLPEGTQALHYLLATPFRYRPAHRLALSRRPRGGRLVRRGDAAHRARREELLAAAVPAGLPGQPRS